MSVSIHIQDLMTYAVFMAKNNQDNPEETRHESKDDALEEIVDSVIGEDVSKLDEEIQNEDLDNMKELLSKSAKMVIETCMDIRRGENVLIVCDPTTGDIGQSLHEATIQKSARV